VLVVLKNDSDFWKKAFSDLPPVLPELQPYL
jgi:hypothetical protein